MQYIEKNCQITIDNDLRCVVVTDCRGRDMLRLSGLPEPIPDAISLRRTHIIEIDIKPDAPAKCNWEGPKKKSKKPEPEVIDSTPLPKRTILMPTSSAGPNPRERITALLLFLLYQVVRATSGTRNNDVINHSDHVDMLDIYNAMRVRANAVGLPLKPYALPKKKEFTTDEILQVVQADAFKAMELVSDDKEQALEDLVKGAPEVEDEDNEY